MKKLFVISLIIISNSIFSMNIDKKVKDKDILYQELQDAIKKHNNAKAIELINSGIDLNYRPKNCDTYLLTACYTENYEIINLLIEKNVDLNATGNHDFSPLMSASFNVNINIVKLLIEAGANINEKWKNTWSLLSMAIRGCDKKEKKEVVNLLIKMGVPIDERFHSDITALILASNYGQKDIIKLLLKANANINACDYNGETPLMQTTRNGHKDVVKLLINAGANVNIEDKLSKTTLMHAVSLGNKEIVELLVNSGANLNKKNLFGKTALMEAVENEKVKEKIRKAKDFNIRIDKKEIEKDNSENNQIVKLLINAGANIFKVNLFGKSVFNISDINSDIKELLTDKLNEIKNLLFNEIKNGSYNNLKEMITKYPIGLYDEKGNNALHLALNIAIKNPTKENTENKNNIIKLIINVMAIGGNLVKFLLKKNNVGQAPIDLLPSNQEILKNILELNSKNNKRKRELN